VTYRVLIDALAQRDIDDFYEYLRRYSENSARKYVEAFHDAIKRTIAVFPHSFSFFAEVGAPYNAFLFAVSRRTAFWVIYTVDDEKNEVRILRFWNTAREPGTHGPRGG
jgi:plasmid stabilization system protein ParE